jgi:hypothetical protein
MAKGKKRGTRKGKKGRRTVRKHRGGGGFFNKVRGFFSRGKPAVNAVNNNASTAMTNNNRSSVNTNNTKVSGLSRQAGSRNLLANATRKNNSAKNNANNNAGLENWELNQKYSSGMSGTSYGLGVARR